MMLHGQLLGHMVGHWMLEIVGTGGVCLATVGPHWVPNSVAGFSLLS